MNPKRPMARHIVIKMSKVKDKERILKAAKQKQKQTKNPQLVIPILQKKLFRPEDKWHGIFKNSKSWKRKKNY